VLWENSVVLRNVTHTTIWCPRKGATLLGRPRLLLTAAAEDAGGATVDQTSVSTIAADSDSLKNLLQLQLTHGDFSSLISAKVLSIRVVGTGCVIDLNHQYVDHGYMSRTASYSLQRVLCSLHGTTGLQRNSWLTSLSAVPTRAKPKSGSVDPPKHFRALYEVARRSTLQYVRKDGGMTIEMKERLNTLVTAKLRPYQLDAVTWALQREDALSSTSVLPVVPASNSVASSSSSSLSSLSSSSDPLLRAHHQYLTYPFEDNSGKSLLLSVLGCKVTSNVAAAAARSASSSGGILGDEMGIGKTLEMQTLLLLHPMKRNANTTTNGDQLALENDPDHHDTIRCICDNSNICRDGCARLVKCSQCGTSFHSSCVGGTKLFFNGKKRCLHCLSSSTTKMKCGATLIVCPVAILGQWESELKKHSRPGALRILVYRGIKKLSDNVRSASRAKKRNKREAKVRGIYFHELQEVEAEG
jgi:hypothetical protein